MDVGLAFVVYLIIFLLLFHLYMTYNRTNELRLQKLERKALALADAFVKKDFAFEDYRKKRINENEIDPTKLVKSTPEEVKFLRIGSLILKNSEARGNCISVKRLVLMLDEPEIMEVKVCE